MKTKELFINYVAKIFIDVWFFCFKMSIAFYSIESQNKKKEKGNEPSKALSSWRRMLPKVATIVLAALKTKNETAFSGVRSI